MWKWSPLLISAAAVGGVNAAGFLYTAATHSHKVTDACGTGAFVASAAATCIGTFKIAPQPHEYIVEIPGIGNYALELTTRR